MLLKDIKLGGNETEAVLHAYISDESPKNSDKRPAVIVCPGGAYGGHAWHEGEPIVKKFFAEKFNAFMLNYTVGEKALFPRPLLDVSLAIIHVRTHAEEYNIDPDKIFVVGFSAGGHLAASIGALWHKDCAKPYPDMPEGLNKPNGLILGYPAIIPYNHSVEGCFERIWGTINPSPEYMAEYGILENISENMPNAYIWHTANDESVPVENSLMLADKMTDFKVRFRMHIYEDGRHGLGLADKEGAGDFDHKPVTGWIDEAIYWTKHFQ